MISVCYLATQSKYFQGLIQQGLSNIQHAKHKALVPKPLLAILFYKTNNRLVNLFRIGCAQEVLAAFDNLQFGIRRVREEFHLLFGVRDRINNIASSL